MVLSPRGMVYRTYGYGDLEDGYWFLRILQSVLEFNWLAVVLHGGG